MMAREDGRVRATRYIWALCVGPPRTTAKPSPDETAPIISRFPAGRLESVVGFNRAEQPRRRP